MENFQKSYPGLPILLVDDDRFSLKLSKERLQRKGMTNLMSCESGKEALEILASHKISIMILDLHMPEMSGEEVLALVSDKYPDVPVIILTAVDDVKVAVSCLQAGAVDYLVKPVDSDRFVTTIKRSLEFWELRQENVLLKEHVLDNTLEHPEAFAEIITKNSTMHSIFKYIESIANSSQPVLITGETGVGKELITRAIHRLSGRKGVLVAVNVAGLDDTTFSDTLFGHKRGAFTGADRIREGLIEQAANGTLFLDEIGDLSSTSQVKLLRLLQEREYYPLGADVTRSTNARLIVATNRDLLALQEAGTFRADLYYRLLLHHIHIPPLRERRNDLPLLIEFFLQQAAEELGISEPSLLPKLLPLLSGYDFPGNIRELRALIFDAVSRHKSGTFSGNRIPGIDQQASLADQETLLRESIATLQAWYASLDQLPTLQEAEDFLIQEALRRTESNQTLTAKLLGTTRQKISRWLQNQTT